MPVGMAAPLRFDTPEQIGQRLRWIRIAFGKVQGHTNEISQSEFARRCDIGIAAWNNAETGDNRIGVDSALKLWHVTGVGLDYVFHGDMRTVPHALAVEIQKLEAAEQRKAKRA